MLSNRAQWFNEGQPVMRHLRDFETTHNDKTSYCLFVAPKLHRDTINTFWVSVKYEYEGQPQKIVPITITEFIEILSFLLDAKQHNAGFHFTQIKLRALFDSIITETTHVSNAVDWIAKIPVIIKLWGKTIAA
jgi:hypothetical protein